ncbi:hypothetical protein [Rhodococcus sp. BE178]|uniref:hypothetical protein n=1 Tax=Rhodococcus sp. BE178 TaxID=2817737 RepID=UPI003D21CD6B
MGPGSGSSPGLSPDGSIYVLTDPGVLTAFDDAGDKLWDADLAAQALDALPVSDAYGAPVVRGNGNPTVVDGAVMIEVSTGTTRHCRDSRCPCR